MPDPVPVYSVDGFTSRVHGQLYARGFKSHLRELVQQLPVGILHDHGLWLSTNLRAGQIAKGCSIPLVISPHGMLAPWALERSKAAKTAAWLLFQRRALLSASILHATSWAEAAQIRKLITETPIAVIPNGVAVEAFASLVRSGRTNSLTALFMSRLDRSKGVEVLISAWAKARPDGWCLRIRGPGSNRYRRELEGMIRACALADTVTLEGPVGETEKPDVLAASDLLVHPSLGESFGLVVAEALAAAVPVVTTTNTPWHELATHGCGWWVPNEMEALAKAIKEATTIAPEQRLLMGRRGRELVANRYSWREAAVSMHEAYEWVLAGGAQPACLDHQFNDREH
jgi:glycosyltransferase involved in cell wall biosynthesis